MHSEGGDYQPQTDRENFPENNFDSIEKGSTTEGKPELPVENVQAQANLSNLKGVLKLGVEARGLCFLQLFSRHPAYCNLQLPGILPVPFDQRVDPSYNKIFFVFFSANFNILS
jgi:hypothetical protein